jgi:hypothetical protein
MPQSEPLTPEQRSLRASIAAHILHASVDPQEHTAPARAASPGSDAYWMEAVDPNHELTLEERSRRAQHLKKAHFKKLALLSAKARRKGAGDAA